MHRHAGFTLMELLIAISIIAILSAIAVPSFNFMNNKRISETQVENLQRALLMARQSAIATNRPTIVCASANGATCGDESMWSRGFMVYEDSDRNGTFSGNADRLLEYIPGVKNVATRQDTSHFRHSLSSTNSKAGFNAQGFTTDWQTFTYCDGNEEHAFELVLSRTGHVRLADGDGASC